MKKLASMLCLAGMLTVSANATSDKSTIDQRLISSKTVMDQIMMANDKSIPMNIMEMATCVGVIPGLKKAAFLVGGEYGRGVVTCRTGKGWSAPALIYMTGGSFGFQLGGQSTDLVLVAVNDRGFQDLLKNKVKLGGDVAAAAGPVGRNSQASTDWKMKAELLTYSRSKGLFAGIDLTGSVISQSDDDTLAYYGKSLTADEILKGDVAVPDNAKPFVRTVAKYFVEAQAEKKK
jgi:lipid-binding SYLF domain-containing protein